MGLKITIEGYFASKSGLEMSKLRKGDEGRSRDEGETQVE